MKFVVTVVVLVACCVRASAHRLDEYLQGTMIAVEKVRLEAQMTLTPGVAVFPLLIAQIDANGDGVVSETERRSYAERVLHDLSLTVDGNHLKPELVSMRFPAIDEMKEGRGEIHLDFRALLPGGGRTRRLIFENHHQSRIAAYQVNCLIPQDPDIRIKVQERNYSQSIYRLEYARNDVGSALTSVALWFSGFGWLGLMALFWVKRVGTGKTPSA